MSTQGIRIKKIRQALSLSQEEFGSFFEITKQYVSLLEKDKTFLNNEKLTILVEKFNVNLNWLIAGKGEMFITQTLPVDKAQLFAEFEEFLKNKNL